MRSRLLSLVGLAMLGALLSFGRASAAPTVVDTLQVTGDLIFLT